MGQIEIKLQDGILTPNHINNLITRKWSKHSNQRQGDGMDPENRTHLRAA